MAGADGATGACFFEPWASDPSELLREMQTSCVPVDSFRDRDAVRDRLLNATVALALLPFPAVVRGGELVDRGERGEEEDDDEGGRGGCGCGLGFWCSPVELFR